MEFYPHDDITSFCFTEYNARKAATIKSMLINFFFFKHVAEIIFQKRNQRYCIY